MPRVGRAAQLPGAFPPGRLAAPAEALGCGGDDTWVAVCTLRGRGFKCLAAPDLVEYLVRRPTQPSEPPRAQAGRVTGMDFDGEKG